MNKQSMKQLYNINILKDKKLVLMLNVVAVLCVIPFWYVFTSLAVFVMGDMKVSGTIEFIGILALLFFYFLLLFLHEGIHGLFFKLFCPENPVKYGIKWKNMMAYATSPGSLYSRGKMLIIGLAPFVLISLSLTLALAVGWINPAAYLILASFHAAGCVGDFYYTYLLLIKFGKGNILVEDTEDGLIIYQA